MTTFDSTEESSVDPLTGPSTKDLRSRLNVCLGRAVTILRSHGRDGFAALAMTQARSRAPMRVVIVGETKRGKSSLANSLAGIPGLSPVGADQTSATFVSIVPFAPGSDEEPFALVLGPAGTQERVDVADVAAHSNLDLLPEGSEPPLSVEIHVLPGPLGQVGIVDSPGIGGLGTARARMSQQQAAAEGGVLLFAVDAGSPLSKPELDFLVTCAGGVEHVLLAVTMTDKYPTTWRDMVAHVGRQLAAHSPRLSRFPVVGVSAMMADAAATASDPAVRAALEEASGIPLLVADLGRMELGQEVLATLNALRTCRSGLENIVAQLDLLERAIADPEQLDALHRESEDLVRRQADLRSTQGRWSLDLERGLSRLRSAVLKSAREQLEALERDARTRIERTPLGLGRKPYVRELTTELVTEYALVRDGLVDQLRSSFRDMATHMFGADDAIPADLLAYESADPGTVTVETAPAPRADLLDPMVVTSLSIGASMTERLAMAVTGGSAMSMFGPVGLIGAGAWAAFNFAFRSNRLERSRLTTEVARSLTRQRAEFAEYVDSWLREIKPELAVSYRLHLEVQQTAINAIVSQARAAQQASEEQRLALRAGNESTRRELRAAVQLVDDALALGHP